METEVRAGTVLGAAKARVVATSKTIARTKTAPWILISVLVLVAFAGANVILTGIRVADNMTILVGGGMIVAAVSAAIGLKSKLIKK